MKKILSIFGVLTVTALISVAQTAKSGYNIKVALKDYTANEIYLGYNFADKKYLKDTAKIQKNGVYVFEGKEPLIGGVYFIYTPSKLYYEILVDENQHFSIESDTVSFAKNAKITGSKVNEVFLGFVEQSTPLQNQMRLLDEELRRLNKDSKDSIKMLREQLVEKNKKLTNLQDQIIEKYPSLFFSKLLKAMREPDMAEARKLYKSKDDPDSLRIQFDYTKNHYWDNFDFTDDKMAYSEVFHNKLKTYFNRFVIPDPDTLVKEAEFILHNARNSKELTKYATVYLYVFGDTSRTMGAENLAVYVGKNYYTKGKANWADSATLKRIEEHVTSLEPITIGKKAPNIRLADTSGVNFPNLANIKAKYTLLVFWEPKCGHCQKEMPKLQTHYDEWKSKYGLEIFAVCTQREVDAWKKFIKEKNLTFTNVAVWPDMASNAAKYIYEMNVTDLQSLNIHKTYYISSTPQVYLLDENKIIRGRRLGVEGVTKLIEGLEKQKEEKK